MYARVCIQCKHSMYAFYVCIICKYFMMVFDRSTNNIQHWSTNIFEKGQGLKLITLKTHQGRENILKLILVGRIIFIAIATQRDKRIEADKSCFFNGWPKMYVRVCIQCKHSMYAFYVCVICKYFMMVIFQS